MFLLNVFWSLLDLGKCRSSKLRKTIVTLEVRFQLNGGFKDSHREKAPSNKIPAPRKSTNMDVWSVGTLNQLFVRGS